MKLKNLRVIPKLCISGKIFCFMKDNDKSLFQWHLKIAQNSKITSFVKDHPGNLCDLLMFTKNVSLSDQEVTHQGMCGADQQRELCI